MQVFSPELTLTHKQIGKAKLKYPCLSDKEVCLKSIVELLFNKQIITNSQKIYEKIMERENAMSTGIGHQIAVPHVRDSEVTFFRAVIYLLDNEIDFNSVDNEKVKLVIFFAIPEDNDSYMKVLSRVAQFLRTEANRLPVFNCDDQEKLYKIFRRLEDER